MKGKMQHKLTTKTRAYIIIQNKNVTAGGED